MESRGPLPPEADATSIISAAFAPLAGKRILDIGCGAGASCVRCRQS